MHSVSKGTSKYMLALKYSHKVVADDSVDSYYTLKIKWKSLFWTSQVWLNVINLAGTFGSGCQEPFKELNQCKKKRYIFLESTAFENLQSKNAWKLLNIYLNGTAGLLGPITIHSRRNKATRWDMFSLISCFPLSSFPSLCSQKEHGIHVIQPHLTKTRVNETFYQHQGSIFISCGGAQAVFRFPYKSQTGFVIWLCG